MSGKHINGKQEKLYMTYRTQPQNQEVSAAKAGISSRSGRRIEKNQRPKTPHTWRTRTDPLEAVWKLVLVPLLHKAPDLTAATLFDYLQETAPDTYTENIMRTLQRRVSDWKAIHGNDKAVIFRQDPQPGRQGLSDFSHPRSPITIQGKPFKHLFYQFCLAYSHWRSVTVVQGGESYSALSTGLQNALQQLGGSPIEHRSDSLSAARNNQTNQWSDRYIRRTKSLDVALPWLYLRGISTGNMKDALSSLLGDQAKGLSPSVVSRLKQQWLSEYQQWRQHSLTKEQWVYLWVDGIYSGLRGEDGKLCALVVIGVNSQGQKKLLAIEDGVRESKQSWREVLLDLKQRGLKSFKLAIGDGALGFWSALDEVYPTVKQQRCWVHKTANVLNKLPKVTQPKAKKALQNIWMAETEKQANTAFDHWINTYQDKYPAAASCLKKDRDTLLQFYQFSAKHWQHIRTTNPIESTFATIRHRSKLSKGCLNRNGMLSMMFKLGICAEKTGADYEALNSWEKSSLVFSSAMALKSKTKINRSPLENSIHQI